MVTLLLSAGLLAWLFRERLAGLLVRLLFWRDAGWRYHDGQRVRTIDPIVAWREIRASGIEGARRVWADRDMVVGVGDHEERLRSPEDVAAAVASIASVVRSVFGVRPHADGGLTEMGCLGLLRDFEDDALSQKKSGPTGLS